MNDVAAIIRGRAERRQLFFAATLEFEAGSTLVRVRNLSATGALVEGHGLPDVGEPIRLLRGPLCTTGTTAWTTPGRAGLSFDRPLDLAAWMTGRTAVHGAAPVATLSRSEALADLARLQAELGAIAPALAASHPALARIDLAAPRIARIIAALTPR